MHGVGRRAAQDCGAHLAEHANLALGVARAHRNGGATSSDAAVMGAEATSEQAVTVADVANVIFPAICIADGTCEAVAPDLEVVLGVATDRGNARGTRRHVDLAHLAHGHGEHLVRIIVPQILLRGERRVLQILERFERVWIEPGRIEALLVERHVLVTLDERLLDSLELQRLEFIVRQRQDVSFLAHLLAFRNFTQGAYYLGLSFTRTVS